MSDSKKFIKAITSGYAFMLFNLLVSLWLVPFSLKHLSRAEYGVFAICSDLLGWLGLTSLGVAAAFNIRGGQLIGSGDKDELNLVMSSAFFSQLASSILVVLVGLLFILKPDWLFGNKLPQVNLQLLLGILIGGYLISFILQPLNALLVANKQVHVDNYLKFGSLAIRTLLTVLLLSWGFKLYSLAISSFVATVLISIVTWLRVKNSLSFIQISWKNFRLEKLKFLIGNGFWFTLGGIAGLFIFRLDSYMIGKYISLEMVASFIIMAKLYTIADTIHQQFFNTTRPYFSQMFGKKELERMSKLYNVCFNASCLFSFILNVSIYVINEWFIKNWVGSQYYLGNQLNLLFCINFIVQAAVLPNRILLATTFYKNKHHALSRLLEGLFKFGFCLWLVPIYGLNVIVIIAILGSLIFSNTFLNLLSSKLTKEPYWEKWILFVFILPLLFCFNIEQLALKILIVGCSMLALVFFTFFKIKREEEIVLPFIQIFNEKIFKKFFTKTKAA